MLKPKAPVSAALNAFLYWGTGFRVSLLADNNLALQFKHGIPFCTNRLSLNESFAFVLRLRLFVFVRAAFLA